MSILVIGSVYLDIKGFPDGAYIPDGRNAGRIEYIHGGVSRNVAEDLGNLGLHPVFLSIVDDSSFGKDVVEHLNCHGVDTSYMMTRSGGMGKWLAVFNDKGDLAGSISERADMTPLLEVLEEKGDEIFAQAECVCVQVDLPEPIIHKLFELADRYDVKTYAVVANMNIATEHRNLFKNYDCFICNQVEAGQLFEEDYSEKTPEELLEIVSDQVSKRKIPALVVTMGEKGSVYATLEGEKGSCPAKKVHVVDTTGAGDAFFAGVTAGLTYGTGIKHALEIGTRLAASVISSPENFCQSHKPEELGLNYK